MGNIRLRFRKREPNNNLSRLCKQQKKARSTFQNNYSIKPSTNSSTFHYDVEVNTSLLDFSEVCVSSRFGVILCFILTLQHRIADHATQSELIHVGELPRCLRLLGQLFRLLVYISCLARENSLRLSTLKDFK